MTLKTHAWILDYTLGETLAPGVRAMLSALRRRMPDWNFQPYGKHRAVACYPPIQPCAQAFDDLNRWAPVSSLCGVLYVVTQLRGVSSWLCGCEAPSGGLDAYHDRHCAKCHRELWAAGKE